VMYEVNALAMALDRAVVNSLDNGLNVTLDGVYLDVPGRTSPLVDGGMGFVIDLDREIAVFHVDNNTTLLFVNTTVVVSFAAIS
jgi:hypothetical protein